MAGSTLVVALMAVSLWLRLSVRLAPGLGPVLRSCLSEVMSFWDLESSRKQDTGGDRQARRPEGPSEGTLSTTQKGRGQESGLLEGQGWHVPSTQLQALGVAGSSDEWGSPDTACWLGPEVTA